MLVKLKCIKEGNKLRIKIISPGYNQDANCQFPKNIRVDGQEYTVPKEDVMMADTRGKFFYRIKKNNIKLYTNVDNLIIYGEELTECSICMETYDEYVIFVPCGHYCCCKDCGSQLKTCCLCRSNINQCITKHQLQ
jgi:hypothetical protein